MKSRQQVPHRRTFVLTTMSEFASTYFLRSPDPAEGAALLERAGVEGEAELVENGWIRLDADVLVTDVANHLVAFNSGVLLWWLYSQDHGWSFRVFEGAACVATYDCELSDCEPSEEMQFDDTLVDYARLAAFVPLSPKDDFQVRLKALLQPDLSSFMDLDDPPSLQFLDLLGLPRPLTWPAIAPPRRKTSGLENPQGPLTPRVVQDASIDPDLLGYWSVVREEVAGSVVNPQLSPVEWVFREREFELVEHNGAFQRLAYSVRKECSPKQIEWATLAYPGMIQSHLSRLRRMVDVGGFTSFGIYTKTGSQFMICFGEGNRPQSFQSAAAESSHLVVLDRSPDQSPRLTAYEEQQLETDADKSPYDPALLGRWKVVREDGPGNWVPPVVVEWLITEDAIEYLFSDETRAFHTYFVRLAKSPQQIVWRFERHSRMSRAELKETRRSMKEDENRMRSWGIYRFKDSMLYVRQGAHGVHPRNFELTPGSGGRLIVLSRISDDATPA